MSIIYFDNAASTRVDPRVLEAMIPFFSESYANPSALHAMAQQAKCAIEEARSKVATMLGANDPSEVIFTAGATEANNAVLAQTKGHILFSSIEHPSIRVPAMATGRATPIPVDTQGSIDLDAYEKLLKEKKPQLVSVMLVNNEIGSVQDINTLGNMAHEYGALFHSDITQAIGKEPLAMNLRPIDFATLSGHKFHAPKGIGAIWVSSQVPFTPWVLGGTHEQGRRAGTMNTPGIVGLGEAAKIAQTEGPSDLAKFRQMREKIVSTVLQNIPNAQVNGQQHGAPHIISLSFKATEGESIIINLDSRGVCCTAAAACTSGTQRKSPVLQAIGLLDEWLSGTVRISLGKFNTDDEVNLLLTALEESVAEVRGISAPSRPF